MYTRPLSTRNSVLYYQHRHLSRWHYSRGLKELINDYESDDVEVANGVHGEFLTLLSKELFKEFVKLNI